MEEVLQQIFSLSIWKGRCYVSTFYWGLERNYWGLRKNEKIAILGLQILTTREFDTLNE